MTTNIDIHADDYGYSFNTSKDIIDCIKSGSISSFSLLTNMNAFDESVELLYREIPSFNYLPLISVHLNLVEGNSDENDLPCSWGRLFSYSSNNIIIKEQLKKEIKKQIEKTNEVVNKCIEIAIKNGVSYKQKGIRIDSHVHTHLIPIVWDSMVEVINEEKYNIEYIRNSKEPIIPFIRNNLFSYNFVNYVKNRILMAYSKKVDNYCENHNLGKMYMWGLLMSGHMDFDRLKKLYIDVVEYANKNNRKLEILFHPGLALKEEYTNEMNKEYYNNFNSANNRRIEKGALLRINEIISKE